jgi:hypothetical protein
MISAEDGYLNQHGPRRCGDHRYGVCLPAPLILTPSGTISSTKSAITDVPPGGGT